jgi:hypothetical protein
MQHVFNPLHIYCRLRDLGLVNGHARRVVRLYEKAVIWIRRLM